MHTYIHISYNLGPLMYIFGGNEEEKHLRYYFFTPIKTKLKKK